MPKFSRHARIEIAILMALALGSCGENSPQTFTKGDKVRLDEAHSWGRQAVRHSTDNGYAIVDLQKENAQLEARLADVEARLRM